MYSYGAFSVLIKDFPDLPKQKKYIEFSGHRFRCTSCGEAITEDIPCQCPFTRVTWDMALWIIHLLKCHTSISAISAMLSVHWSTIQKIQKHIMDKALAAFETCLKKSNYRPRYLAVDEFAIHKGHRYATCVMDLETGFILWAGLGRLDDLLVFNDDWGTYRGTAWRITAESWLAQPVWRKLFGVGPGMMHTAVAQWAGADITERMRTFYAAHNEYLELLLTTGVAGLAAWLWFVIAHLRKAAHNWLRPGVAPVTLALVSYLAHAVISIRVSMIFPEIMLLFALLQVFCLPPEQEENSATAEKPVRYGKGKKTKSAEPVQQLGLLRQWLPPIVAGIAMMAVCGAASRVIFGFLF